MRFFLFGVKKAPKGVLYRGYREQGKSHYTANAVRNGYGPCRFEGMPRSVFLLYISYPRLFCILGKLRNNMHEKITCFLIDDDEDDQEIFTLALGNVDEAIHCITANDGIEALHTLNLDNNFIPDFIFLDLNMVRMNGLECLVEIRKIQRLQNTPIIIYSTSSEEKDISATRQLGAADYIIKPPSMFQLEKRLEQVLRRN